MTKIPQAADPTKKFDLKYDAWNRLVEVKNNTGTAVTKNEYDGLNRRILKTDTKGTSTTSDDNDYDYYYNRVPPVDRQVYRCDEVTRG